MKIINRVSLLVLLLSCMAHFSASAPATAPQELAGQYSIGTRFSGSSITIDSTNGYHIDSGDCTQEYYEAGTYVYSSGILTFTPLKRTVKSHGAADEKDVLSPEGYREVYHEEPPKDLSSPSQYTVVKWSGRIYLIPKESLLDFCNAVNLGVEPRSELNMGNDYFGSFYLREGDESKAVSGLPVLPTETNSYILTKPVDAEVTRVEGVGSSRVAFVDKGSQDGLKPKMKLSYRNRAPSMWEGIEVVEVGENWAKVKRSEELKVGDKLSTKVRPYFDQYGPLPFRAEKERLDEYVNELKEQPMMIAYILVYSDRRSRQGEAQTRAERAKNYLVKEDGIDADRVVIIDGGKREEPITELYLKRFDQAPPVANPTVK